MDRRKVSRGSRGTSTRRGRVDITRREDDLLTKQSDTVQEKSLKSDYYKGLLPGYLYYFKSPPTIANFEKKVAASENYLLHSSDLVQQASNFEIDSSVSAVTNNAYYPIFVEKLKQSESFCNAWPTFDADLTSFPDEIIDLWSSTAHKVILKALSTCDDDNDDCEYSAVPNVAYIRIGIFRFSPLTTLSDIKSSSNGQFVSVKGIVIRTGSFQPYISSMSFRCKICETRFNVTQTDGNFTQPSQCESEKCTNKSLFETLESVDTTSVINSRIIRIQDTICNDGGIPTILDCLLLGDLVDKCSSSDVVTFSGIVRTFLDMDYGGVQSTHKRYIKVSALQLDDQIERTTEGHLVSFTDSDYDAINEIGNRPDIFRSLVSSLCPRIFGEELIKAGLLLSMLGGRQRNGDISRRGDINMLMIGDPGVGKSHLLKTIVNIAPKAIYICGNGSTVAGLTVTLSREGSDYSLDAGALVLADKGMICIDELDKMANHHNVLLEAMEQQTVTITKAGVYRSLPARVSVFAAGNPVGGHYDSTKTILENINISPPLLSRFDIIFKMLDRSDVDHDKILAHHILRIDTGMDQTASSTLHSNDESDHLRLRPREGQTLGLLPPDILRKYIAYARQYVHPQLSTEAGDILKAYFLKKRREIGLIHSIPPTTRLLVSLIRLTEARAKMELREIATSQDAKEVLLLFEKSLDNSFEDKFYSVSVGCVKGNKKASAKSAETLLKALQCHAKKENRRLLELDEIKKIGIAMGFSSIIDSLIAKLNWAGDLLMKGGQTYQLTSIGT